ncbi:MAG: murein tripeptide amidase MpaA [Verrucomicrobiae bacterium]|nr:murein tripeptide amidase MpaA [Verrucomicrobiae bacterium]
MRRSALHFSTESYGRSRKGTSLEWVPQRGRECRTLLIAGVHGEEPETTVILSRALRCLTEVSESVACVLAVNPDGLVLGTRGNAMGIDLNRNFPAANWQAEPVGYRWHLDEPERAPVAIGTGDSPASEPETSALIRLIDQLSPRQVIALHAPLACVDDPNESPIGKWLAERSQLPLVTEIGYPTPGSMGSWAIERGLPLITWEFPKDSVESLSRDYVPILTDILNGIAPE